MSCRDYVTLAEIKAFLGGALPAGTTDAALAAMLFGAMDYADEAIFGHPFNRAVRLYHTPCGATACTVAVSATAVTVTITDGAHAGIHTFTFALYATIAELVAAINAADVDVLAEIMWASWVPNQPSANLETRAATNIFGIENWCVLCLSKMQYVTTGAGTPILFLPFTIGSVLSVYEDGTLLTAGTDYRIDTNGWLERICSTGGVSVLCGAACAPGTCYTLGYWSCASPCNIVVTFVPMPWTSVPRSKIGLALAEFLKTILTSTGMKAENMGRYGYQRGDMSLVMTLLSSLVDFGLVLGKLP